MFYEFVQHFGYNHPFDFQEYKRRMEDVKDSLYTDKISPFVYIEADSAEDANCRAENWAGIRFDEKILIGNLSGFSWYKAQEGDHINLSDRAFPKDTIHSYIIEIHEMYPYMKYLYVYFANGCGVPTRVWFNKEICHE